MMVTYRKQQDGSWAVFGPAAEVQVGSVEVQTKAGKVKREQIRRVSRPFQVDGVPHCYGYLAERRNGSSGGQVCAGCGRRGASGSYPDSSGLMGPLCGFCRSHTTQYERSYA